MRDAISFYTVILSGEEFYKTFSLIKAEKSFKRLKKRYKRKVELSANHNIDGLKFSILLKRC